MKEMTRESVSRKEVTGESPGLAWLLAMLFLVATIFLPFIVG